MELKKLRSLYDDLLKDIEFDKLELGLQNPNIFEILKISKTEIRHSNFLSWILNPNGSHQLGDIFLKRFLREVFSSEIFNNINQVDVEGIDLSNVEVFREWNNIDLLIKLDNIVICIENKVLSKESSNQLSKYKKVVENNFPKEKKLFVYLTPEGDPSRSEQETYQPISYDFIIDSLERIISVYKGSINRKVLLYITDYITIIKRELMGTDKLSQLSQKIYTNHKELFDFIIEHKPDVHLRLNKIFQEEIKNRGWLLGSMTKQYIRFSTTPIQKYIYYNKNSKGLKKGESFLFEIVLSREKKNKMSFKTVITPCDKEYNRKRLKEIIYSIKGFKKSKSDNWSVTSHVRESLDYQLVHSLNDKDVKIIVNSFLDKCIDTIKLVEDTLNSHSDELIKMTKI